MTPIVPNIRQLVQDTLGSPVISLQPIQGGYTCAQRMRALCKDGSSCFVKVGADADTASWLRTEAAFYTAASSPHMARFLGFFDHPNTPTLLLEDLSQASWSWSWSEREIETAMHAFRALQTIDVSQLELPSMETQRTMFSGWARVADDPTPFLSLGLCSSAWLDAALPTLLNAEASLTLQGTELAHFDLRSDNMCRRDDDTTVFVDWNWACVGSSRVDLAGWLPSLHLEGGPRPETLLPNAPSEAAALSGYWASKAGLPDIPQAPRVRTIQRAQLKVALPWATRALGLG